jgi:mono/diheme cytochrome c family protein
MRNHLKSIHAFRTGSLQKWGRTGLVLAAASPYAILFANQGQSPSKVSFGRDISPLIGAHCASCHSGPNAGGGLDLSTVKGWKKGGDSGPLWVAGDPKKSILMQRLLGQGGLPRMPKGMAQLNPDEIQAVQDWIAQGAKFDSGQVEKHWAYVAPVRPTVPTVKLKGWVRNPIDSFVLQKMESEGLKPSPEASKETLIRRVSLDLIGLPPTVNEIDAFLADRRPDAYERLVDRLLASPHYGERQAREWLDLARYADSDGYEKDLGRTAWKYRDWVIDAYNRNLPYDKFTIDQIAGDLLPDASLNDKIATGFNRNTMFNREGGVDQAEAHFAVVLDRVDTTGTVFLGSTLGCARCHDHKYDPFKQRDYYRMAAYYGNTVVLPRGDKSVGEEKWFEPEVSAPSPAQARTQAQLLAEVAKLQPQLSISTPQTEAAYLKWKQDLAQPVSFLITTPSDVRSEAGQVARQLEDSSVVLTGPVPDKDTYQVDLPTAATPVSAFRLETLPMPKDLGYGCGRADNGNFVLTRFQVLADGKPVSISHIRADYVQSEFDPAGAIDGDVNSGWAINTQTRMPHRMIAVLQSPVPAGSKLQVVMEFNSRYARHLIGRFRVSETSSENALNDLFAEDVRKSAQAGDDTAARKLFVATSPYFDPIRTQLRQTQKDLDELNRQIPTAMVMQEKPTRGPLTYYIHHRGEFLSNTELVTAGTPAFLPGKDVPNANRLTLGQWIVSKKNPLTARVQVNRMWEQVFGRGIVETSEDFGTRGSKPINQKLLDWLACEFMDREWDMKAINRLIVTSATYRQSSAATPTLLAKDPQNLLFARGPRFRMEAEMIHDATLAESGLLSKKVGGPSVYPYQPAGIWDSPYSGEEWMSSKGEDAYRRGIYTFLKRTAPYPSFLALDSTSRESCTVRRIRTNTPLQALALLNDALMMDASKALGREMEQSAKNPEARLTIGFRLCTGRKPTQTELVRLKRLLNVLQKSYGADKAEAAKLAGNPEDAAYAMVGNVLLNLDEAITKE